MKVILLRDIKNVGMNHDVKEVAEGYARNFLFPRKLAEPATPTALRNLEKEKAGLEERDAEVKKRLKELARKLTAVTLEFSLKTDAAGTVFGSVTKEAIAKALREHGLLGKERVEVKLDHPLKAMGEHRVPVDLKKGIAAMLTVLLRPQR